MGLLVVGCFECYGFPVRCAEASRLLEVSFEVFSLIAVTLDTYILVLVSKTYHLACLVPPFYHPRDRSVSLGTPWGTMGAAGRTRGVPKPDDGKHSLE